MTRIEIPPCPLWVSLEDFRQLRRRIHQHIRRGQLQPLRHEAVVHPDRPDARILPGQDVDIGIADDHRLLRPHPGLGAQRQRALGVGLLGGKAVAAIDLDEERADAQCLTDTPRRIHRLVRQHHHLAPVAAIPQRLQGLLHALVEGGVVQLVLAVVEDEVLQGLAHQVAVVGVAQGAADQHRRAVAHVALHHLHRQLHPPELAQHGIDRIGQVYARIHQRAVQIEDQQLDVFGGDLAVYPNHSDLTPDSFRVYPPAPPSIYNVPKAPSPLHLNI